MQFEDRTGRPFKVNWLNAIFLSGTPILAVAGAIWHGLTFGIGWVEVLIFFTWYLTCGLSITVGYHRLFSHRSHEARWPLRLAYAVFGAGAFQNSILEWCSDHRRHHRHTDDDHDPYSASRGFWWSHMFWIFIDESEEGEADYSNVKDLQQDWVVRWQHRHIYKIGFLSSMLLPGLVGFALAGVGGAIGGFVWGGLMRTVFLHHGTFLINSAAHFWGKQPYSDENSSKDSFWLAFFTFGEGYHNFHHSFQADYRNGHRWWQWDPSKWFIRAGSLVRLNRNLKRAPRWSIETLRMDREYEVEAGLLSDRTEDQGLLLSFSERAQGCREALKQAMRELDSQRAGMKRASKEYRAAFAARVALAKAAIAGVRAEFRLLMADMDNLRRSAAAV